MISRWSHSGGTLFQRSHIRVGRALMFDVGSKLFWLLSNAFVFICKQLINISSMLSPELLLHNRTVKQVIVAPNRDSPSYHISCIACCMFILTFWGLCQSMGKSPSVWRAYGVHRSPWSASLIHDDDLVMGSRLCLICLKYAKDVEPYQASPLC